jgi:hypothetical protein
LAKLANTFECSEEERDSKSEPITYEPKAAAAAERKK